MQVGIDFTGITTGFICHDGKGNFLIAKRSENCRDEKHTWDFGAGRLEFGEDPEDGARRELKEEYGVEPIEMEFLGHANLIREHEGKKTHWIGFAYLCQIDPEKVVIGAPESIDEIKWVPTNEELPQPFHKGAGHVFEKFKEKIRMLLGINNCRGNS